MLINILVTVHVLRLSTDDFYMYMLLTVQYLLIFSQVVDSLNWDTQEDDMTIKLILSWANNNDTICI
jgi:hypothetical protein